MSIAIFKRKEACLRLLRNDFDVESTVKWVIRQYADDPAMERAKNKDRLARNIITIGGSGDQQQMNLVAFQQALIQYTADLTRRAENKHAQQMAELQSALDRARSVNEEREIEYREQTVKVQELQEKLHEAEKKVLALPAAESPVY